MIGHKYTYINVTEQVSIFQRSPSKRLIAYCMIINVAIITNVIRSSTTAHSYNLYYLYTFRPLGI